jgi:RimJ/RimL family protein N-acetyltransferase
VSVNIVLVPVTAASLDAELAGDLARLATLTAAAVTEWPPIDGEWDRDAMDHLRGVLDDEEFDAAFGAFYVVIDGALGGHAGFFGPPDADSEVEIGYSVCRQERRRGCATAVVGELCRRAGALGAGSVRARTTNSNVGSIEVLRRNGFQPSGDDRGHVVFRRATVGRDESNDEV